VLLGLLDVTECLDRRCWEFWERSKSMQRNEPPYTKKYANENRLLLEVAAKKKRRARGIVFSNFQWSDRRFKS
jgi:hypothetical protein